MNASLIFRIMRISTSFLTAITLTNQFLLASGTNWAPVTIGPVPWHSIGISADGNQLIASADNGTVWLSFDSGRTWTNTLTISENRNASYSRGASTISADASHLLAAPGGGASLFLSKDNGMTWQDTGLKSSENTGWNVLTCSSNGMVLAAANSGVNLWGPPVSPGSIYLSNDGGNSWNEAAAATNFWTGLACSADGKRIIAAVGGNIGLMDHGSWTGWVLDPGPIIISEDKGKTWSISGAPKKYWRSIACSADGSRIFAAVNHVFDYRTYGTPSAIYSSENGGKTWNVTAAPLRSWNSVACSADGSKVVASCDMDENRTYSPLYTSVDGGRTWIAAAAPPGDPLTFDRFGQIIELNTWPNVAISGNGSRMMACWNGHEIWSSAQSVALELTLRSETVVLSWPVTAGGFVLQECPALENPNWSTVPITPHREGEMLSIARPARSGRFFYRLIRPFETSN